MSQLQATRNEFHFGLTDRCEFISKYFISPRNENSCKRPLTSIIMTASQAIQHMLFLTI